MLSRISFLTLTLTALIAGGVACQKSEQPAAAPAPQQQPNPRSHFLNNPALGGKWRLHSAKCVAHAGGAVTPVALISATNNKKAALFEDIKSLTGGTAGQTLPASTVSVDIDIETRTEQLMFKALTVGAAPGGTAPGTPAANLVLATKLTATTLKTYDAAEAEGLSEALKVSSNFLLVSPKMNGNSQTCGANQKLQIAFEKVVAGEYSDAGLTGTWKATQYNGTALNLNTKESVFPAALVAKLMTTPEQKKTLLELNQAAGEPDSSTIIKNFTAGENTTNWVTPTTLEVLPAEARWKLLRRNTSLTAIPLTATTKNQLSEKNLSTTPPTLAVLFTPASGKKLLKDKVGSITLKKNQTVTLTLEKQENAFPTFP